MAVARWKSKRFLSDLLAERLVVLLAFEDPRAPFSGIVSSLKVTPFARERDDVEETNRDRCRFGLQL